MGRRPFKASLQGHLPISSALVFVSDAERRAGRVSVLFCLSRPLSNDLIIAITAINDAEPCPVSSSGFSELLSDGGLLDIEYRIVGKTQSNVTFTCVGGSFVGTDPMAMVLDAIAFRGPYP